MNSFRKLKYFNGKKAEVRKSEEKTSMRKTAKKSMVKKVADSEQGTESSGEDLQGSSDSKA